MRFHDLSAREWGKAFGVGVANGLLLSAVMVTAFKSGVSPLPKPVGLAFAETVLGGPLPLPVGLAFHLAYVTFWSMAFVAFLRDSLTLRNALALALALWIGILVVFFPIIGWGFLGLAISPKLIVASLVPHVLFGVFLWGLCRFSFRPA
ncbi:MAG: hypothetical protein IIC03_13785 [Proteobacteria bacterium]|nr:hypothetical protein [Pseudomonadota bacterium]